MQLWMDTRATPRSRPPMPERQLEPRRRADGILSSADDSAICTARLHRRRRLSLTGLANKGPPTCCLDSKDTARRGRRPLLVGRPATARAAEELRILAWQGFADDDWVAEFEKEAGSQGLGRLRRRPTTSSVEGQGLEAKISICSPSTPPSCSATSMPDWHAARPVEDAEPAEDTAAVQGSVAGARRGARRQGLRHPFAWTRSG